MKRITTFLLYTLPVIIFFSYYPVISFGTSSSTNFELSLPIIWLILFFCATIIYLPRIIKFYQWRKMILIAALPLYATLSVLWSPNHLRAFLTAGLLALTFYSAATIVYLLKAKDSPLQPVKHLTKNLIKTFLIATVAICIICWLQCVLDIAGLGRDFTALCLGCTYTLFGFPHPSGFAIEPQFMGNLLLAPTLLTLYLATKSEKKSKTRLCFTLLAFFFIATLFLTFSRGAIYAFALGLVAIIIYAVVKRFFSWRLVFIPIAAFACTLCAQGLFAQISPTNDTFATGITKAIHQLTLGKVDLREVVENGNYPEQNMSPSPVQIDNDHNSESEVTSSARNMTDVVNLNAAGEDRFAEDNSHSQVAVFDGYVEDSTNIRVNLTNDALDIWNNSPTNILFGTGLGSAGTVLYENHKTSSPKEIVQNQYASLLLELGLVGLLLAAAVVIFAVKAFATNQKSAPVLVPLVIAYAATLFFFAGLPNALQIYLLPPLLYVCLNRLCPHS